MKDFLWKLIKKKYESNASCECFDALTDKDKLELVTHIHEDSSWLFTYGRKYSINNKKYKMTAQDLLKLQNPLKKLFQQESYE